jgi:hypothetical protein
MLLQEAADLTQRLESAGLPISTEHFWTAGYGEQRAWWGCCWAPLLHARALS